MSASETQAQQIDEQAIRQLVDEWLEASKRGDLETVLSLMTDDVLFMVPGQDPFGKEAFAANSRVMKDHRVEGISDIQEIKVLGDWAWMHNYLRVTVTGPDGNVIKKAGHVLSVLRKNSGGRWQLARDANLLM
ncbi:MAG TPA: SgcJ/EcaC family oxidoreductase [Pyrinomonadaceae bacterium]|nr:SgcJ/EcaC family oxidoreductase [Pyrinomonadaceae bacterium]